MTIIARSCVRRPLTPLATVRSASMSRPESVSSRMASLGSSTAIWKISFRFFSPPEKPSLTERPVKLWSIATSFIFSLASARKSIASSSSSPRRLRSALRAVRRRRGEEELDAMDFLALAKEKMKLVAMDQSFTGRSVNEGFSGGEKKRNEIFQMAVLDPKLAILDETDSGLDIDALRTVASGVNSLRSKDRAMIVITHYQRLLEYIVPDRVHVMGSGRIVRSGGRELALELEQKGYAQVEGRPTVSGRAGGEAAQ